ncbi:MAG: hypothetical protein AAGJ18_24140, partial [Bacteroidota bacterium]
MQRFMQTTVGCFLLVLIASYTQAQTAVKTTFTTNKTKYYKGRIDDINDITVSLTCDGKNCTGDFTYLRSRDEFKLQGTIQGNQLQLREFNRVNKCTGYLNGTMEGTSMRLDWKNKEGTVGNSILLKEVARKPDFPTFCGDNKWINAYSGNIKGEAVEMILHRVDNNRVLGTAFFTDRTKKVLIKGTLSEDVNLHLIFVDEQTAEEIGSLRGIYKANRNLNASFYNNQQSQSFAAFTLTKSLGVSCLEYADYYTNYDFLFPKSEDAIFNEVMVLLTNDWIKDCRERSQKIRKQTANATTRSSQRAYSWSDVTLLNESFVSGMLTYHATWLNGELTKTFNYDLTNGENIELANIFKKGFDYEVFIKKEVGQEIIKNPLYK